MMLYKLLSRTDPATFSSEVISLTTIGAVGERIRALGVRVEPLRMRSSIPSPLGFVRLVRRLRQSTPDVVQTWMYHADLLGGLASALCVKAPIVWCIQS